MAHRWGIIWGDMHAPFHDRRAIDLLFEFTNYAKPDFHINIGDLINCGAVSSHNTNNLIMRVKNPIDQDFDYAAYYWDALRKASPKADLIWIEGNHEDMVRRYNERQPETRKIVDIQEQLRVKERGITYVPYLTQRNNPFVLGGMRFIHGWFTNKYHAAKTVEVMGKHVCYGHSHDVQSFTKQEPGSLAPRAHCVGHLSNERSAAMFYQRTPNNWSKAFGVFQYDPDERYFAVEVKDLGNYRFSWAGKMWKAGYGKAAA